MIEKQNQNSLNKDEIISRRRNVIQTVFPITSNENSYYNIYLVDFSFFFLPLRDEPFDIFHQLS